MCLEVVPLASCGRIPPYKMFFSRLAATALLAFSATALALPTSGSPAVDLARRSPSPLPSNLDLLDEAELSRRAIAGLSADLHALAERSETSVTITKRATAVVDANVDVNVQLTTAFNTCTDKIAGLGVSIEASIKALGNSPSVFKVVAAVKADIAEVRVAVAALAVVVVKVYSQAKADVNITVSVASNLIFNLLAAVHVALGDLITLISGAPLLLVLLAGELLAISAQLVITVNTLISLLGADLKVALQNLLSIHADVLAGLNVLGLTSLLAIIHI
ncbi:hypothetical protein JCM10213v2_008754 [Rhodosporidiobolus nylandii]